jgi:hypothetical protein
MSEDLINTEAEACNHTIWKVRQLYCPQLVALAVPFMFYEGNSVSKLQIQVVTYVFELSAGNCHR